MAETTILDRMAKGGPKIKQKEETEENSIAKLAEEMKSLPSRVAERLAEFGEPLRRRRIRRFHPMMIEDIMHSSGEPSDPVGILIIASLIRDDLPWLYELSMEVYRAIKEGDKERIKNEVRRIRAFSEIGIRMPWMEEFADKETHMLLMEFPLMLERFLLRAMDAESSNVRDKHLFKKSTTGSLPKK